MDNLFIIAQVVAWFYIAYTLFIQYKNKRISWLQCFWYAFSIYIGIFAVAFLLWELVNFYAFCIAFWCFLLNNDKENAKSNRRQNRRD